MSECGISNFGATFSVSTTPQNTDLTESEFSGLTYTPVPGVITHGDTGVQQNIITQSTWDRPVVCKSKGEANAGDGDISFVDAPSAGMDLLKAYAAHDNTNSYATKVEWADGSIEYNRGLFTGPQNNKGGNEDFKQKTFTFGYVQVPVEVEAPSS